MHNHIANYYYRVLKTARKQAKTKETTMTLPIQRERESQE
jgi:hypothetical protein